MICDKKSNIKLKSNIITKEKWIINSEQYLPFDLLPEEYRDPSLSIKLTQKQKMRYVETLFHCKRKREVKERIWQTDHCYENCQSCNDCKDCY